MLPSSGVVSGLVLLEQHSRGFSAVPFGSVVQPKRGRAGLGLCELRASRRGDAQQGCVQKSRDGQGGGAWSCWHRR